MSKEQEYKTYNLKIDMSAYEYVKRLQMYYTKKKDGLKPRREESINMAIKELGEILDKKGKLPQLPKKKQ